MHQKQHDWQFYSGLFQWKNMNLEDTTECIVVHTTNVVTFANAQAAILKLQYSFGSIKTYFYLYPPVIGSSEMNVKARPVQGQSATAV